MTLLKNKMFSFILIILIIIPLLVLGFWVLVPKFLETPKFTILEKNKYLQIRKYDEMTLAKIITNGERYDGLR